MAIYFLLLQKQDMGNMGQVKQANFKKDHTGHHFSTVNVERESIY
jgi:hypothetical protein